MGILWIIGFIGARALRNLKLSYFRGTSDTGTRTAKRPVYIFMAQRKSGANRRTRGAWKCAWSCLSYNVNTGSKLIHEHEHSIWTHTMDSSINHGILIAASPEKMKKWRQIYKANLKSLIFLLAAGSITLASPVLWTHKRSFVEWHDLAASEISLPNPEHNCQKRSDSRDLFGAHCTWTISRCTLPIRLAVTWARGS